MRYLREQACAWEGSEDDAGELLFTQTTFVGGRACVGWKKQFLVSRFIYSIQHEIVLGISMAMSPEYMELSPQCLVKMNRTCKWPFKIDSCYEA